MLVFEQFLGLGYLAELQYFFTHFFCVISALDVVSAFVFPRLTYLYYIKALLLLDFSFPGLVVASSGPLVFCCMVVGQVRLGDLVMLITVMCAMYMKGTAVTWSFHCVCHFGQRPSG